MYINFIGLSTLIFSYNLIFLAGFDPTAPRPVLGGWRSPARITLSAASSTTILKPFLYKNIKIKYNPTLPPSKECHGTTTIW